MSKLVFAEKVPTREKSLFDIMRDEPAVIKKEDKAKVSTQWKLRAFDVAVNQIGSKPEAKAAKPDGTMKDASSEHIIRCAILKGMRMFQSFSKIKTLLKMLEEKAAGSYTTLEENLLYSDASITTYPLKDLVTKSTNHPVYVTDDTAKYIGKVSPYLKVTQCDLMLYFFCLGVVEMDDVLSGKAVDDIRKVIRAINARIMEREYEIERFYRYKSNPGFLDTCLMQE